MDFGWFQRHCSSACIHTCSIFWCYLCMFMFLVQENLIYVDKNFLWWFRKMKETKYYQVFFLYKIKYYQVLLPFCISCRKIKNLTNIKSKVLTADSCHFSYMVWMLFSVGTKQLIQQNETAQILDRFSIRLDYNIIEYVLLFIYCKNIIEICCIL